MITILAGPKVLLSFPESSLKCMIECEVKEKARKLAISDSVTDVQKGLHKQTTLKY